MPVRSERADFTETGFQSIVHAELDRLAALKPNWDAQGASPVSPAIIEAAPTAIVVIDDRGDIDELGRVYFEAYDPGTSWPTVEQATADVRSAFEGEYGELWKEASQVVALDDAVVAAVLTVRRPPWDDTPDCPFIIDLFTDRAHRRRGLARALIGSVLSQAASAGESGVALRVRPDNMPALDLYGSLGFRVWNAT
jgi:N-alpha-acetyltransferase 10/11